MHARLLTLCTTMVAGLLAIPLPAGAVPMCPATSALCIDESVEGSLPIITTSPGLSGLVTTSIIPVAVAVGEQWAITITFPFTTNASVSTTDTGLTEPGSQLLSDALKNVSISLGMNLGIIEYNLFSDNELGQIGITSACCDLLAEDGTFQLMPSNFFASDLLGGTNVQIYLKSDASEVPEPGSLALLLSALGGLLGLLWLRRRNFLAA
jgi:PEP-CTERM motif